MAFRNRADQAYESAEATIAMAGWTIITQGNVTVSANSAGSYTVSDIRTNRVAFIVTGTTSGDIRFAHDGTASASSMPLPDATYMVLELEKDQTVGLYNDTGSNITVYLAELR